MLKSHDSCEILIREESHDLYKRIYGEILDPLILCMNILETLASNFDEEVLRVFWNAFYLIYVKNEGTNRVISHGLKVIRCWKFVKCSQYKIYK